MAVVWALAFPGVTGAIVGARSPGQQRGVYAGAWQAYLDGQVRQTYSASMRVTRPSRFFVLEASVFAELMREWLPMAVHLLDGGFFYRTNLQEVTGQRERLLALGSLSAGQTHELNNPAAVAVRAAAALREQVAGMRCRLGAIAAGPMGETGVLTVRAAGNAARWWWRSATPARGSRRRSGSGYSSRSSPPSQWAGTGLGLDITSRIVVNKHHGNIAVESVPGDTRFGSVSRPPTRRRSTPMTEIPGIDPSVPPSGTGCAGCDEAGGWWVHLRRCAACGHVGCCDTSPSQHATAHWKATGHPFIQSFEPGEDWFWNFETEEAYDGPRLAPPVSHPAGQPVPGPVDRVPRDWRLHVH